MIMSKIHVFFLVFILSIGINKLNAQVLSAQAEISIITCAPGKDLYSTFGHSAIRIKDPAVRMDNVYNYGTFNFETPNFYIKFMRGQLDYMLSVAPYRYFVISYMNENRWIKEQVLDLNRTQKNEVYSYLQNNALPENMYYRYDFFMDNCATRVKDVIKDVLKDDLILPETITNKNETYRDLLYKYIKDKRWVRFGINLALGHPTDKVVNTEESTFLPDYLETAFDKAVIKVNGESKSIVKEKHFLFEAKNKSIRESEISIFSPIVLFSVILFIFLGLTILEFRNKKYYLIADKTLFFILGLVGFVILVLWFGTEHAAVVNNQNVIWTMPLFLIAAFRLKKINKSCLKWFFLIMSGIILISLIINITIYTLFDFALIPLLLTIILRSVLIFKKD